MTFERTPELYFDASLHPESMWTIPTPWQEHPEWWHSESVDATEREVSELVAALVVAVQPEVVVESGANTGQTSELIGRALARNGHGHCWSAEVDPQYAALAEVRCEGLPVTIVQTDTAGWLPPGGRIGLAFLDSSIAARSVELASWRHRFVPGAVVVVHDTGPQHAVMGLIRPVLDEGWLASVTLRTPRGVTVCVVVDEEAVNA